MIRVLTIGNSFAENATQLLGEIVEADGTVEVMVGKTNLGGCSLEKHWNVVRQCELFADVKPYQFRRTGLESVPATLREALQAEAWDYVTLQQVSRSSWEPETYEPFFGQLLALVRELAPQARPVIHQTWAHRIDATWFEEAGIDQKAMHEGLVRSYGAMAEKYDLRMIPSGNAFALARKELNFSPDADFDYADPSPGALPNENGSLHVGGRWATGNTPDGNAHFGVDPGHCSTLGLYLGAAVWFEMLTGKTIADNGFRPEGVTEDEVAILKTAAHEAVVEAGGPLAVG
jgi:uncharacterized protein DUF4886